MRRKGKASWRTLLNLMYWHAHRVVEVCPFGMQEPTLEPRLPAILTQLKQFSPQVKTTVYSNMGKYDETFWRSILRWGVLDALALSFYGVDKPTYERMQSPLQYEKVKANIKKLVKLKRRLNVEKPFINLHILLIPETIGKANALAAEYNGFLDEVGFVRWDSWCGQKPYNDKWETRVWGPSEKQRTPCPRLWRTMNVHFDGTVVPCCLDANELEPCGNVNDDPQAWYRNERLNELRTLHLRGQQDSIDLCRSCTVWRRDHDPVWNSIWREKGKSSLASCVISPSTK